MLFCSFSCHSKDGKASRGRPICGLVCPSLVRCLDVFLLSFYFSLYLKAVFFSFFPVFFYPESALVFFFFQTPVCWWLFLLSLCGFFIELTDHFAQNSLKKATIKEQPREPAENVRDWRLWAWTRKGDRKTATRLNCPLPCFVLKAEREPVQRSAHLTTCTSFGHGKLCRLVKKKNKDNRAYLQLLLGQSTMTALGNRALFPSSSFLS